MVEAGIQVESSRYFGKHVVLPADDLGTVYQ